MKPYEPNKLPLEGLDYQRLFAVVGDANAELARYDGLLQGVVNPSVMLSALTNEEAVLSSKIEGTQATIDEVLEQEAGLIKEGKKGPLQNLWFTVLKKLPPSSQTRIRHKPFTAFSIYSDSV